MRRLTAVTIAAITMLAAGAAFAQGPIKIGFLAPLSGAIAQAGKDMYSGCELFWEESGWQIAGRKLDVILEDNGGQAIQKLWTPLNIQDYGPYVAQIKRDTSAVFINGLGRWTVLFAKEWAGSGLKDKIPLIAGGTYSDEHVLPQLGDESIGVISAHNYSAALDTPENRRFRAGYEKKYNRSTSVYSENCYSGAQLVSAAIKAVNGKVEDRAALMNALRTAEIKDAPRGPIKMDSYGNPIQNIYVRKVERVNGKLQNTVIYTYPAVSQFWKYNPEEFLKQPVYSRDFPPCRHC